VKRAIATSHPLLLPGVWDTLPRLGVGQTAQVFRAGPLVVKVALPGPEARARLKEEVTLNAELARHGVPVPRLHAARPDGRALVRDHVDGRVLSFLSKRQARQVFGLLAVLRPLEERLEVRFDVTPSNLRWVNGQVWLLDAGRRVAPPRFTAKSPGGLARQWKQPKRAPRLTVDPLVMPPSGRFHVDVEVGTDPKARMVWTNRGLKARLGLTWTDAQVLSLGALSTRAPPHTTHVASRYVDMIALDRRRGPKGDGRAVLLGTIGAGDRRRELSLKGLGPTPLAWKGRAFHEDGFVSFPRALWEATVADELARLGFDTPEYLAVCSTSHTTRDNTGVRWPALSGLRVARTHLRLGHLRAWSHQPTLFLAMLNHAGREVLRPDFDATRPAQVRAFVAQFARNLGHDIGRTDALQIHGFNPTPGNVRLDGHLIDYSTVRFLRDYFPDWRFLENRYAVRIHRLVWRRLVSMLVQVLNEGGVHAPGEREALRWFDRAFIDGFSDGLRPFFDTSKTATATQRRAFVGLTERLRALRRPEVLSSVYWKQRVPAPRFDVLGKAPELIAALARGHRAPWQVLLVKDDPLPRAEQRLAARWVEELVRLRGRSNHPGRRWSQVVRPFVEAEALATLLYRRKGPRRLTEWKRLMSTSQHLPEGKHSHQTATRLAKALGHVERPRLDGQGSLVVVGLTPELLEGLEEILRKTLGAGLVGCVAHGSRVMNRRQVREVAPEQLEGNDLTVRAGDVVREFGPVPGLSSDLDLKVFVRRGGFGADRLEAFERTLGAKLAELGAWFPFSHHQPPRQRLIETGQRDVRAAFDRWNGVPRRRALGKGPIPRVQVVVLF